MPIPGWNGGKAIPAVSRGKPQGTHLQCFPNAPRKTAGSFNQNAGLAVGDIHGKHCEKYPEAAVPKRQPEKLTRTRVADRQGELQPAQDRLHNDAEVSAFACRLRYGMLRTFSLVSRHGGGFRRHAPGSSARHGRAGSPAPSWGAILRVA